MPIPFAVAVSVGTECPYYLGGRVTVEGPARLRYSLSGGLLPRPYLDGLNALALEYRWWDEPTGNLILATLENAVVIKNHLGWRPFPKLGFQFEVGYAYVGLGGGLTGAELVEAVYGYPLPPGIGENLEVDATADLHMFDATVGYEAPLWKGLFLRVDAGASLTLAVETTIEPAFDIPWGSGAIVDAMTQSGEDKLDVVLLQYVNTPTLSLAAGWKF